MRYSKLVLMNFNWHVEINDIYDIYVFGQTLLIFFLFGLKEFKISLFIKKYKNKYIHKYRKRKNKLFALNFCFGL